MSRQKTRKRRSSKVEPAQVPAEPLPAEAAPEEAAPAAVRKRLAAAVVLAVVWYAALLTMAVVSANPVTLNLDQVQAADYVVQADVIDVKQGTVRVAQEWKRGRPLGNIVVESLTKTSARAGRRYVIPLTRIDGDRYRVTATNLPGHPPLIYPDGEDAQKGLRALYAGDPSPAE